MKRLAAVFLVEHGCQAVALEVAGPIPRYRIDVAGYADGVWPVASAGANAQEGSLFEARVKAKANGARPGATTVLIECKQARADFLRDRRDMERLIALRERLALRREFLERTRIRHEEPELRRSDGSLFVECEAWDFAESRLPAYQSVLRRIERIEEQIYGETKFCMIARYRLADRMYILAPRGMVRRRELPPGWGLLECAPRRLRSADDAGAIEASGSGLTIAVESPVHVARADRRARLLRNIAVAATKASIGRRPVPRNV